MLLIGDLSRSVNQVAVHTNPSELAPLVENKYLVQGRVVSIIDGPVCGTGNPGHVLFWKVQSEEIVFSNGQHKIGASNQQAASYHGEGSPGMVRLKMKLPRSTAPT